MSELLALGASHKTAPLAVRERIALPEAAAERFLRELVARARDPEAVVALDLQPHRALPRGRRRGGGRERACSARSRAAPASARPSWSSGIYSLRNCDAARHLYRVASGLESMVVGEAEVQGQVKRAYELRAGRAHDRPADQQALPRRAGHRQARAHGDRDLRRPGVASPPSRSTPPATRSATWPRATC